MERLPTYQQLYSSFRWNIPARYNIAADVCDRHAADASKIALIGEGADGKTESRQSGFTVTKLDRRGLVADGTERMPADAGLAEIV
jgi:acetyl-CoA synthetase